MDSLEWEFIEDTLKAEGHGDTAIDDVRHLQEKRSKPYFLWTLYFNEVFSKNGGFDIVIGNPPYVQIQSMQEDYKVALEREGYESFIRTGDLYCLFYERGYGLSRDNGQTALITSNSWVRTTYGEKLRHQLKTKTKPTILIDFADNQMFEKPIVNTNILIFGKHSQSGSYRMPYVIVEGNLRETNFAEYINQKQKEITLDELSDSGWTLGSDKVLEFKRKIEKTGTILKNWDNKINYGIKTGRNEAFIPELGFN